MWPPVRFFFLGFASGWALCGIIGYYWLQRLEREFNAAHKILANEVKQFLSEHTKHESTIVGMRSFTSEKNGLADHGMET
jgi:hypothetical protein